MPVKQVNANTIPKMTGVEIQDKELKAGLYPTLKLSSSGCNQVQYSVYVYSPAKRSWENVSGGYTPAVKGNTSYSLKLKAPLLDGKISYSVWVKKAGAQPTNKGGYDDARIHSVTVSSSQQIPKLKSVKIDESSQKAGTKPTIKVASEGDGDVQYRAYLYSPAKKVWEDVTGGYTKAFSADSTASLKLNKELHSGENSFSVWVKRAGQNPVNKDGFDNALIYKVDVGKSNIVPSITSVSFSSSGKEIGGQPVISLKSNADVDVQYKVYLYSQIKGTWSDVSNGFTSPRSPEANTDIKITEPLQPGRNTFSIWVKRAGHTPNDPAGYDSVAQEVINAPLDILQTSMISNVSVDKSNINVGSKPNITVTGTSGDGSDISYKAFLYSNKQGKWTEASNYTSPVKSGNSTTITLSTPLEEGINKVLVCSKRSKVKGEVYEYSTTIEIDAIKPGAMKKKIVIDPGHGGKDPGALGATGLKESHVALNVGFKLGEMLKSAGYNVVYTRTSNDSVAWNSASKRDSLDYRANFANSGGADLFLSIHCNSNGGTPATGTETYYSSKYVSKDKAFADSIHKELVKSIGLKDRGLKSAGFDVLNNTKMTAALAELAFINNPSDEAKLKDEAFLKKCAEGLYKGIVNYK